MPNSFSFERSCVDARVASLYHPARSNVNVSIIAKRVKCDGLVAINSGIQKKNNISLAQTFSKDTKSCSYDHMASIDMRSPLHQNHRHDQCKLMVNVVHRHSIQRIHIVLPY